MYAVLVFFAAVQ